MVAPLYIVTIIVEIIGIVLVAISSATGAFWPGGTIDPLVVGSLLIALGIAIGMLAGGVRNPYVLAILPLVVAVLLLGIGVFQWLGPGVRI
jgi:hypothetical protein